MFAEIKINLINDFPIPTEISKTQCERLSSLSEQMLSAQAKLRSSERRTREQRVLIPDREIDTLVYELYNLDSNEIKIVEGG